LPALHYVEFLICLELELARDVAKQDGSSRGSVAKTVAPSTPPVPPELSIVAKRD